MVVVVTPQAGAWPGRVVPSVAERWSHAPGGSQLRVVPCRWRATTRTAPEDVTDLPSVSALQTGAGCPIVIGRRHPQRFPIEAPSFSHRDTFVFPESLPVKAAPGE